MWQVISCSERSDLGRIAERTSAEGVEEAMPQQEAQLQEVEDSLEELQLAAPSTVAVSSDNAMKLHRGSSFQQTFTKPLPLNCSIPNTASNHRLSRCTSTHSRLQCSRL